MKNRYRIFFKNPVFSIFPLLCATLVLSNCSINSRQGPSALDIDLMSKNQYKTDQTYVVFNITPELIQELDQNRTSPFLSTFGKENTSYNPITLGVDDILEVNIWEASAYGLFSTREVKQTSIKTEVDENGEIFVPYVGRVSAFNKTVEEIRKIIENGLKGKAVEPQVQVILAVNNSNNITIVGDVNKPGQYPLPTRGLRLMEAIAIAGGTPQPTFESEATILRKVIDTSRQQSPSPLQDTDISKTNLGARSTTKQGTVRLDETLSDPQNNIWLSSHDTVQILNRPRRFAAFGAVESKNLVPFKTETLTLAEALAMVGGLRDDLADSGGVFLFRFEDSELIETVQKRFKGTSDTLYTASNEPMRITVEGRQATVYRLNFNKPQAFFMASNFLMRDKDIIYIANAPTAEFNKFMTKIVGPIVSLAKNAR